MPIMAVYDQFLGCEAALALVAIRCFLSLALDLFNHFMGTSSSSHVSSASSCCSPASCSSSNIKLVTQSMTSTTLGNIKFSQMQNTDSSCAVCLDKLKPSYQVWELINCSHVFHKHCLEKWVAYDNRLSCPLCRASLLPTMPPPPENPSWVVEQMLYLFGDDLLL